MTMFQPDLLAGKVVLITGGGTGLGRTMAQRFLSLGARVAICGRREAVLEKAVSEMSASTADGDGTFADRIFAMTCDVRDPASIEALIDGVIHRFGQIDILVNNAAGNFISPTVRLSPRAIDSVLNIVLHGTAYMTLELGKRWIAHQQPGVVLNIVTTYASTGSAYVVPSAMAKAGVLALTRSLAVEWAPYGIRHVAIAPGPFPTEGAWSRLAPTPELADHMVDRIPLKRVGDPTELANLASYLVSDFAGFINGEVITIDGGEWLQGAGEFNDLRHVTDEQWDHLREMTQK